MEGFLYRTSKEIYDSYKYPTKYIKGKMVKSDKPLREEVVLEAINQSLGLIKPVTQIEII